MAQPTNTFDTYDSIGTRDDLSDVIHNISPTQTPFLSMAAKSKARNTLHEWQTDSLATAGQNAVIEGDDATLDASTPTVRVGNYTQISDKTVVVSGTQEATDKAGRRSEMSYQIAKRAKELKRSLAWLRRGLADETTFRVGTLNVLGDSHTARGGNKKGWASGYTGMGWAYSLVSRAGSTRRVSIGASVNVSKALSGFSACATGLASTTRIRFSMRMP